MHFPRGFGEEKGKAKQNSVGTLFCKVSELNMNEQKNLFPESSQTKLDRHTLALFSPCCVTAANQDRQQHPSVSPCSMDQNVLHASASTRMVCGTSTEGKPLYDPHPHKHKHVCFSLSPSPLPCPLPTCLSVLYLLTTVTLIQRLPKSYFIAPGVIA